MCELGKDYDFSFFEHTHYTTKVISNHMICQTIGPKWNETYVDRITMSLEYLNLTKNTHFWSDKKYLAPPLYGWLLVCYVAGRVWSRAGRGRGGAAERPPAPLVSSGPLPSVPSCRHPACEPSRGSGTEASECPV